MSYCNPLIWVGATGCLYLYHWHTKFDTWLRAPAVLVSCSTTVEYSAATRSLLFYIGMRLNAEHKYMSIFVIPSLVTFYSIIPCQTIYFRKHLAEFWENHFDLSHQAGSNETQSLLREPNKNQQRSSNECITSVTKLYMPPFIFPGQFW